MGQGSAHPRSLGTTARCGLVHSGRFLARGKASRWVPRASRHPHPPEFSRKGAPFAPAYVDGPHAYPMRRARASPAAPAVPRSYGGLARLRRSSQSSERVPAQRPPRAMECTCGSGHLVSHTPTAGVHRHMQPQDSRPQSACQTAGCERVRISRLGCF